MRFIVQAISSTKGPRQRAAASQRPELIHALTLDTGCKMMARLVLLLLCACVGVSAQCPDGCECLSNQEVLRCFGRGSEGIDSIPSMSLPHRVRILDIRQNSNLTQIGRNDLQRYSNVRILLMTDNAIESIHHEAFRWLTDIEYIYLHTNKLSAVPAGLFKGLGKLRLVSLFGNTMHTIGSDAFDDNTALKTLYLHDNKLTTLDQRLFDTTISLQELRIDDNPLVCNCSLLWLKTFQPANTSSPPICDMPIAVRGRKLLDLQPHELSCGPPIILTPDREMTGRLDDDLMMNCLHAGSPSPEIKWLHNDVVIMFSDKYSLMSNGSLLITSLNAEDVGMWTCVLSNVFGQAQMDVNVTYVGDEVAPEIIQSPSRVTVSQGSTAELSCKVRAYPKAVIVWRKNKEPLPKDGRFIVSPDYNKLRIFEIESSDAGSYTCSASNSLGSAEATIMVVVKAPPTIVGGPASVTVLEGRTLRLQCNNSGDPTPTIVWIKNRKELETGGRIIIKPISGELEVVDVKQEDAGQYMCRAINDLGAMSYVVSVTVKVPRIPSFYHPPQSASTVKGGNFTLTCRAYYTTTYLWLFNSAPLEPSDRITMTGNGDLTVTDTRVTDEGEYTCMAFGEDGMANVTASVSVFGDLISCSGIITPQQLLSIRSNIDEAINETKQRLIEAAQTHSASPSKLLMLLKFPTEGTIELSMAAEIFAEAIARIEANASLNVESVPSKYPDTLSECELEVLATLSGCEAHKDDVDCTDFCLHSKYRSYDGTCNNVKHPRYGAAETAFPRLLEADYENDINLPHGWSQSDPFTAPKPSSRVISTRLFSTNNVTKHTRNTLMLMQIGQFLDHDMDIAPVVPSDKVFVNGSKCDELCGNEPPCFPIMIPPNDTRIQNKKCMAFTRSSAVCGSGSSSVLVGKAAYRREQINSITSFIDASMVYGSSEDLANRLKESASGRLRMGDESIPGKHFLPYDTDSLVDCMQPLESTSSSVPCFLAGDVRVNEQLALTSMHTVFSREHNRIADKLAELNPHWSSEKTYQEARKILGAQWQTVIYDHYLPIIMGPSGMQQLGKYEGYDATVNPGILNSFATAAYRFGHSQIMPIFHRFDKNYKEISEGHIPLFRAFFSPFRLVQEGGIDPLLRGLISTPVKVRNAQQVMTTVVTERLFEESNQVALDLGALNVQRGRDHGLPGYNQFRSYCNLSVAETFEDLADEIPDQGIRDKLQSLYNHPDNIDLMVGGLLEEVEEGGHLGPTFRCIIMEQFKRLRDGDRFWFQNPGVFTPFQVEELKKASLAKIICTNADDIQQVPRDVFILQNVAEFVNCSEIEEVNLNAWKECDATERCSQCDSMRKKRSTELLEAPGSNGVDMPSLVNQMSSSIHLLEKRLSSLEGSPHSCHYGNEVYTNGAMWLPANCLSCSCQSGYVSCSRDC